MRWAPAPAAGRPAPPRQHPLQLKAAALAAAAIAHDVVEQGLLEYAWDLQAAPCSVGAPCDSDWDGDAEEEPQPQSEPAAPEAPPPRQQQRGQQLQPQPPAGPRRAKGRRRQPRAVSSKITSPGSDRCVDGREPSNAEAVGRLPLLPPPEQPTQGFPFWRPLPRPSPRVLEPLGGPAPEPPPLAPPGSAAERSTTWPPVPASQKLDMYMRTDLPWQTRRPCRAAGSGKLRSLEKVYGSPARRAACARSEDADADGWLHHVLGGDRLQRAGVPWQT